MIHGLNKYEPQISYTKPQIDLVKLSDFIKKNLSRNRDQNTQNRGMSSLNTDLESICREHQKRDYLSDIIHK